MYNLNHKLSYGWWRLKWLVLYGRHTWNLSISGQCPRSLLCCCSESQGAALIYIIWHSTSCDYIHARKKEKGLSLPCKDTTRKLSISSLLICPWVGLGYTRAVNSKRGSELQHETIMCSAETVEDYRDQTLNKQSALQHERLHHNICVLAGSMGTWFSRELSIWCYLQTSLQLARKD